MNFMLPMLMAVLPAAVTVAQSQSGNAGAANPPRPKTTEVMVIETVKPDVALEKVMAILPQEVRATVQLYLDGKIRQWYSRGDGRGVVFILDAQSEEEAKAVMESLPLAKEHLMEQEYITLGPLMPLRALLGGQK